MELLGKLGIDWKLLIAQIINFFILLYVLKRFAYKPVLKLLEDRKKKIEKGLKDTEEAHRKLTEIVQKEKEILNEAHKKAQVVLKKAEDLARKNKEEIALEAKTQAEKIIADAKVSIESEKTKILREVKSKVAELVVLATEKVIGEKIDEKRDRELIEKSIKQI